MLGHLHQTYLESTAEPLVLIIGHRFMQATYFVRQNATAALARRITCG